MAELDDDHRSGQAHRALQEAQKKIADDYVNGYLFQLAKTGVANAKLEGLWENAPTQANDLTGVGDFGTSYTYRVPVSELIAERVGLAAADALRAGAVDADRLPGGISRRSRAGRAGRPTRSWAPRSSASRCRISGSRCCWCWSSPSPALVFRRRLSGLGRGLLGRR
jgi:hypothetical protein